MRKSDLIMRRLHFVELESGRFGLGIGKMDFARVCHIVAFAFVGLAFMVVAFVVVAFVVVVRMARGKEHSRGDGYAVEEYLFHKGYFNEMVYVWKRGENEWSHLCGAVSLKTSGWPTSAYLPLIVSMGQGRRSTPAELVAHSIIDI